ncbi:MAG: hydroxymethylbilane synthase [Solirubrobacteraceae bacterium]|nr:hydroxymethylbilane synthase [Solirubrobacteraceae bacterium]
MVRLGTRGSALALAQARLIAGLLGEDEVEIVEITTTGDRDRALVDKEKWVKELELALLAGEIDLAVHSAKDVPGELPDGLDLLGAPARADARDALCGAASLADLPPGAKVGTSSLRRRAQVLATRDDVSVVEMRGNVDTRLGKLAAGEVDALLLASAGLERLGRGEAATARLDFVPAPGQGVIALEGRTDDAAAAEAARRITDRSSWIALLCERTVVTELGATCHTPVGAHATLEGDDLTVDVFVGLPDGGAWLRDTVRGKASDPEELGRAAAGRAEYAGARDLLQIAEGMAAAEGTA